MEVGQAVLALDLVDAELDLAEGVVLVLLEISERNLEYPALQSIVGVLETGGSVDKGLSDTMSLLEIFEHVIEMAGSYSRIWKEDGAWSIC